MWKKILIYVICAAVLFASGFACGIYYQKKKGGSVSGMPNGGTPPDFSDNSGSSSGSSPNFSKNRNGAPSGNGGPGGGGTSGEIISASDTSITVKTNDGSTKIVYLSDSTSISKNSEGSKSDLTVGTKVMVNGTNNSDNSVTSKTIMIEPANSGQETPSS